MSEKTDRKNMMAEYDVPTFENATVTSNIEKYTSDNPLVEFVVSRFLGQLCQYVERVTDPGDRLLDAGCGSGIVTTVLGSEFPDRDLYGIDIDRSCLRNARGTGLDGLVHGNLFSSPFSEDEFDCVLSLEVLEHLEEPGRAVRELRRVSSNALVVSVPNDPVFRLGNVARLHNLSSLGDHPDHTQHFSSFSFSRFLSSHVPVEDVSMPGYVWTMCLADASA